MKKCFCGTHPAPLKKDHARAYEVGSIHSEDGCLNDGTDYLRYGWDASRKPLSAVPLFIHEMEFVPTSEFGLYVRRLTV